ncbi:unnamed protein product, partial [marine sediment metagenome]
KEIDNFQGGQDRDGSENKHGFGGTLSRAARFGCGETCDFGMC